MSHDTLDKLRTVIAWNGIEDTGPLSYIHSYARECVRVVLKQIKQIAQVVKDWLMSFPQQIER